MKKYIYFNLIILLYSLIMINESYACIETDPVVTLIRPSETFAVPCGSYSSTWAFEATATDADNDALTWFWGMCDSSGYYFSFGPSGEWESSPLHKYWNDPPIHTLYPGQYGIDFLVHDDQTDGYGNWIWQLDYRDFYVIDGYAECEYSAIPYTTGMYLYYHILPENGWSYNSATIYIKDSSDNIVFSTPVYNFEGWIYWDGKGNVGGSSYNGEYLPNGDYSLWLYIDTPNCRIDLDQCYDSFSIYYLSVETSITDPAVNGVRSGLDLSTLRFELNGNVINNELLSIDETYSGTILTDLAIQYCDLSIYSIIIFGENTVKVDIDDNVDNHMNQIIQTFYLP